jgi:pimeloyl-ACP methyl ester carboxylesterase
VARLFAAVAAAALALIATPAAEAKLAFKRCGDFGFRCARLTVPLDRTGAVPGKVSLYVKRVRAQRRRARGATFVLAGGPGQSATDAFGGDGLFGLEPAFRRRDLIVYDQRGTGRSGALRCRRLERTNILDAGDEAADCAARLGPRRAFYTTPDSVEDIEAIRRRAGYERIALYGTSYGSKVALAYALKYPANVERLVLDSVVEADGPDSLYLDSFEAVPRALAALCRAACRQFTKDPVADVQALVARLAAGPLSGSVYNRHGRRLTIGLTRTDVFSILVSGDFDPTTRAGFPAAVRAALEGDPAPILRLRRRSIELESPSTTARAFSTATYAAATCEENLLPWPRGTPFEQRRSQAEARVNGIAPEAFAPFDRLTALDNDILRLCSLWPEAAPAPVFGSGPLPDVPVLLLEGEDDLRTPVEAAQRVAAQFSKARLYVAPATGHSALGSDFSGCIERAFERFFLGRRMPGPCRRRRRSAKPSPPPPAALEEVRAVAGIPGRRGRTIRAVGLTLLDVLEDYSATFFTDLAKARVTRGAGLRGGRWTVPANGDFVLERVRFVPGVRVSGRIRRFLEPRQRGRLRVSGRAGSDGLLVLRGDRLKGRLDGRRVKTRLSIEPGASAARAGHPIAWPPRPGRFPRLR